MVVHARFLVEELVFGLALRVGEDLQSEVAPGGQS